MLCVVAQNNAIRPNCIKAQIDHTQEDCKYRPCGNRNETCNHISEFRKLAKMECKNRHSWARKVIPWKLSKKPKFLPTDKWYINKPESVLENETHEILWDFEIQMDQIIQVRRQENWSFYLGDFSSNWTNTWTLPQNRKSYGTWSW